MKTRVRESLFEFFSRIGQNFPSRKITLSLFPLNTLESAAFVALSRTHGRKKNNHDRFRFDFFSRNDDVARKKTDFIERFRDVFSVFEVQFFSREKKAGSV